MKKITKLSVVSLATILLLDGCASTITANKRLKEDTEKATVAFKAGYDKVPVSPLFVKDNGMWVNPKPLPVMNEAKPNLPVIFQKNVSLTFPGRVSLNEIISELSRSTGVVFSVAQDVYKPDDTTLATVVSANTEGNANSSSSSSSNSNQPVTSGTLSPLTNTKNDALITVDSFVYRGDLKQALDVLSQKSNLSWKWTANGIQLFRYESRNFYIAAFDGTTNRQTAVSTAATTSPSQGGGSSGGGGQQGNSSDTGSKIQYSSQTSSMDEITAYLRSMMSSGGRISTLGSAGIITVRDTPQVLSTIDSAIKELNATLTKQVAINVQIYNVALTDGDTYSVDWNAVWASNKYNVGFSPLTSSSSSTSTSTTGGQSFSTGILTGPFSGTKLVVNALSSIGNIVSSTQNTAVTLNGQSAPLISQEEIAYVKSTTVTTTGSGTDANTSVQINPDTITQGLNMIATPKIQPNGKVLLEYNINLANVKQIVTYSQSGTSVQLPTRDVKSIIQRASLKSGQTLVLAGFQDVGSNVTNQGVLSPNNLLLGGSKNAQNNKTQLVILITPYITDN